MSATPSDRDQRAVLDHRDEVVAERRQDGADRLRHHHEAEALPGGEAEGLRSLDLAGVDGLDAGAEDLRRRRRHSRAVSAMIARHISETSRVCAASPIGRAAFQPATSAGAADEGDVEEQHQHRDAADDLDVEARRPAAARREPRAATQTARPSPSAEAKAKATTVTKSGDADALWRASRGCCRRPGRRGSQARSQRRGGPPRAATRGTRGGARRAGRAAAVRQAATGRSGSRRTTSGSGRRSCRRPSARRWRR